jgi:hypothetical protein
MDNIKRHNLQFVFTCRDVDPHSSFLQNLLECELRSPATNKLFQLG